MSRRRCRKLFHCNFICSLSQEWPLNDHGWRNDFVQNPAQKKIAHIFLFSLNQRFSEFFLFFKANANEKYLYSRVTELEKRNQKLEKKVKKLKRKKKELKQEVVKLRGQIQSQGTEGGERQDEVSTSAAGEEGGEVEVLEMEEEVTNSPSRSNDEEEHVCASDINRDFVDQAADDPDEVDEESEVDENQSNGQSGLNNEEESAGRNDVNCNEEHDDEAGDRQGEVEGQHSDHHGEVENRCSQCGKTFVSAGNLKTHIRSVHGPKKKCNVCKKFFSAGSLKTHVKEIHEGDRRQCPECKKEIASSKLSEHMQHAHLGFKKECPRCGKHMASKHLSTHIKEEHEGVRKKCPFCTKQFRTSHLSGHIREVHQGIRKKKKKCPHCPKLFGDHLNQHIQAVHQGIRKKCPYCPKDFAVTALGRHLKKAHAGAIKS